MTTEITKTVIFCGDYKITLNSEAPGKIWISHISGEGGCFDKAKFDLMVEAFYRENF